MLAYWWARSRHGRLQGCAGPEAGVHPLVLLPWVLEPVRFCVCPVRVGFLFPTVLWNWSPKTKPCWPSETNVLGLILPGQDPRAGEPSVELRPIAPWWELLQQCLSSSVWVPYSEVRLLAALPPPSSPTCHMVPALYLGPDLPQQ